MPRKLFYATTNPGKLNELRSLLAPDGVEVLSPVDVGLSLDVPEDGHTLEANATAKAIAYMDALDPGFVVVGDDTGVEIDALGGEPGIRVRRWDGSARMQDEAIIRYCLDKLAGVPAGQRGAQFRTVFAIGVTDHASNGNSEVALYDGTLRGVILDEPDPLRIEGFPFESIFYVPAWSMLLGTATLLPAEQRKPYVTHRTVALHNALPHLRALMSGD